MPTFTALTTLTVKDNAEALAADLETLQPEPTGVGIFEMEDGSGLWEVGGYFDEAPDQAGLALLATLHGAKPFAVSELPETDILVLGPPPTSGTRDAFVDLAMHAGCKMTDYVKNGDYDKKWVKENCSRMRTDGPFIEAGENDNLIVQRLGTDTNAMGIFGYSFLYENLDKLKGVEIDGVEPTFDTIGDKSYPISRPLYFYVKNAHRGVIPNLQEFIAEYMSENALAPGGYLSERGLVPLSDERRAKLQDAVINGKSMEPKQ